MTKVFLLAPSLRKDSVNLKLLTICAEYLKANKCNVDLANMAQFDVPLYNGDIETSTGVPENAKKLADRMKAADYTIFSVPEYNYSIPGIFKNLIDWVSRISPMPWADCKILLISASPSMTGGHRGFWNSRIPLEGCGAFVHPMTFSLGNAYNMIKRCKTNRRRSRKTIV